MKWKIPKLEVGTADEWADWREQAKTKYPIRYFIQEDMASWFRVKQMQLRDVKYWFLYRLHPKHKYNIIRPSTLKPNYYDPDTLMLHSNMHLLVEFVDGSSEYIDWGSSSGGHDLAWKEMQEIYVWWKNLYPNRDETFIDGSPLPTLPTLPKEWGFMSVIREKFRDDPIMLEWKRITDIHNNSEGEWHEKENEMLSRLINIRRYLWY